MSEQIIMSNTSGQFFMNVSLLANGRKFRDNAIKRHAENNLSAGRAWRNDSQSHKAQENTRKRPLRWSNKATADVRQRPIVTKSTVQWNGLTGFAKEGSDKRNAVQLSPKRQRIQWMAESRVWLNDRTVDCGGAFWRRRVLMWRRLQIDCTWISSKSNELTTLVELSNCCCLRRRRSTHGAV